MSEPIAWGIASDGRLLASYTCADEDSAREMAGRLAASGVSVNVVPLYRQPAMTDAEREALEIFGQTAWTSLRWSEVEKHAATLRGLLERLSPPAT